MNATKLATFFQDTKKEITPYIHMQCQNLQKNPISNSIKISDYIEEYTLRGKMIRASLVRLSVLSFGKYSDEIYQVGATIELAQSALLMHDDVIDGDDTRRGRPAMHKILEKPFQNLSHSQHIGKSLALCIGDVLLFHIFSQLPQNMKLIALFADKLTQTALGQELDVYYSSLNQEISKEDIFTIMHYKTSQYTFALPLLAGAIIANKDNELEELLEQFALLAGYIFQIRDDELNLLTSHQINKSTGGDIRENKKTLCRFELINCNPTIKQYFGSDLYISDIHDAYYHTGASENIQQYYRKFIIQAKKIIQKLPIQEEYQVLWEELLFYLLERQL